MTKMKDKLLNEEEILYRWRMAGGWEIGQLVELNHSKMDSWETWHTVRGQGGQHAWLGCWVDAGTLKPSFWKVANIEYVAHQLVIIEDPDERQVAMIRVIEHSLWNSHETHPEGMLAGAHNVSPHVFQERVDFGQAKYSCPIAMGHHRCDVCREYRGKWLTSQAEYIDRLAHMSKNLEKWRLAKVVGFQLDDFQQHCLRRDLEDLSKMKISRVLFSDETLS